MTELRAEPQVCPFCGGQADEVQRVDATVSWASHRVVYKRQGNWETHMWMVNEEEGALPIQLTMKGAL